MLTIYKYELPTADKLNHEAVKHTVQIPMGATILSAISQKKRVRNTSGIGSVIQTVGVIVVYAQVDTDKPLIDHTFYITGTGYDNSIMEGEVVRFIDSVNTGDGWIWHTFHKPYGR